MLEDVADLFSMLGIIIGDWFPSRQIGTAKSYVVNQVWVLDWLYFLILSVNGLIAAIMMHYLQEAKTVITEIMPDGILVLIELD